MKKTLTELDLEIQKRLLLERCRTDVNTFIEFCFGVKQHKFHRTLQNAANTHQYIGIDAPVEHGKTASMSVYRPVWLLGKNPFHSLAIVSNAIEHPARCVESIRDHIENNERVKEVFPHLELKQSTKTELTVVRPSSSQRDASIIALGINGTIIGRRWTGL